MYDLSKELNDFYNEHVTLPQVKIDELLERKNINIDRLESGLEKYNEENDSEYTLESSYTQGSVGMKTVTQSEENDYDIDIGILIEGEDMDTLGSDRAKNIILDAFNKIDIKFNTPPEKLTNCIRITYATGYQIDFAVYRKISTTEHAGSEWRERDPEAIQGWFELQKLIKGENLPSVIQLIKMFNKSRSSWRMPGGLVTTILVEESLAIEHDRLDKALYYTIEEMVDRLNKDEDVKSPVYPGKSILYNDKDKKKIEMFKKRLESYLEKLEVLNDYNCSRIDAIEAWQSFFNHTYWDKLYSEEEQKVHDRSKEANYTEQYIEEKYPVNLKYELKINANIDVDGFRRNLLTNFLKKMKFIPKDKQIQFFIESIDIQEPYDIYWKVRNVGAVAYKRNQIRGQINKTNSNTHTETSNFKGRHFVECYIVKDGICVARDRINVPI